MSMPPVWLLPPEEEGAPPDPEGVSVSLIATSGEEEQ
jgi:hypothetical protein